MLCSKEVRLCLYKAVVQVECGLQELFSVSGGGTCPDYDVRVFVIDGIEKACNRLDRVSVVRRIPGEKHLLVYVYKRTLYRCTSRIYSKICLSMVGQGIRGFHCRLSVS